MTKIYRKFGLEGVCRGYNATLIRDTIAYGAWFGTYGTLKSKLLAKEKDPPIYKIMLIGACSGEMYWFTVFSMFEV